MKLKNIFLVFTILIGTYSYNAKAQVCDILIPICTSQDGLNNNAIDPSPLTINSVCQDLQGTRTAWYRILIDQPTNFTFQIEPTGNVDYDFAVWLNADCANLGTADRASFDAPGAGEYDTGLDMISVDLCETAAGDGQLMFMSLVPGDEIIIVVDRFSSTEDIFNLSFGDPDAFDCSIVLTEACEGDTVTFDATDFASLGYEWFFENPIGSGIFFPFVPAETNGTLDVTQTGYYKVEIQLSGGAVNTEFFEAVIYPLPIIASPAEDIYQCDNGTNTGIFDLTVNTPFVLGGQDPLVFEVKYYGTLLDSQNGINELLNPAAYLINTPPQQTIYVRIQEITAGICFDLTEFIIDFSPVSIGVMTDYGTCDADADGFVDLDLILLKDPEALNGLDPLLFNVSYHASQIDADAGANAFANPYTVTAPLETIFVRVENDLTPTCFATDSFDVSISLTIPALTPTPYILCDEFPNDGFAEFDLTTKDIEITGGNPDAVLTYHLSLGEARSGLNPILTPAAFINTIPNFQTLYPRVENINTPECYDTTELDLQVDLVPAVTDPVQDYFLCDNDEDGIEIFDLTIKDAEILNTLVNVTLTYHNSEADAEAGVPVIGTPSVYPSGGEEIWFRAENLAGCITVRSFELVLGLVPTYTEVLEFDQCDDEVLDGFTEFNLNSRNIIITGGDTTLAVTYYLTQGDADAPINPLAPSYTNALNPETIFVRVESNTTGCYGTFAMELEVIAPPDIFMPTPLEYCDEDNDGFGVFILSEADSEVTGGIPTGNLMVTYHETLIDSQNGVEPILDVPYSNINPFSQTVYVRLLDQSTGCFSLTTLELIVLDSPQSQIIQPVDMTICDDDGDGIAVFDLTLAELELLNGLDPLLYTITYFEDVNLTIPIANPTAYSNIPPSPQTIYIVVEDIANGCQGQTILLLWVYLAPVIIAPTPIELCDITDIVGPDDQQEYFDLDSKTDEITGGDTNILITYHETQADADAGTGALSSPYINTSNAQTIFIRAEDSNTTCITSLGFTLDLVVNPLPSPVTPDPLEVCDGDNNGFAEFMLTDKDLEIIGGEPDVVISYHVSLLDAQNGVLPLLSPYPNIVAYDQTVFARAEYPLPPLGTGTGCYRVVELDLKVIPSPEIPLDLQDLIICDDDGFAVFDLTERAVDIYGTQDPLDYVLTYYLTQLDAEGGINSIGNPEVFPNTSNPQTIWVRLEDNITGCEQIGSFDLVVELLPTFIVVTPFEQCDDEILDGFTEFDLNSQNDTITGGDDSLGVTYYPSQGDADAASNPLVLSYTNSINPETIYVRIESSITGCYDTFAMELIVIDPPTIFQPDPLEVCDVDNDGFGEFILTDADLEVTGGVPIGILQVSYHISLEDAQNGDEPILDIPYLNIEAYLQMVYVRLFDQSTGCYSITTLDLVVLDSPQIVQPTDLELCDANGDGIEVFDLTLAEPELLNGLDPDLYTITYYVDAALLVPIGNPAAYSNLPLSPQTIFIVVEDIANGCRSQQILLLWVHSLQVLIPPTPLELCDATEITGPDDQQEYFDLESKTDEITGGDTTITVTYHATQAQADAGTDALESPYINTSNPQTIFIHSEDLNTGCIVSQNITLDLVVNPLPSPVTPDPLEVCDVDNDGIVFFMLTDKDEEIIGGEPGVVVSYHENLIDAENGAFALTSPYTNIQTPTQVIYVRAEYPLPPVGTGTGCFRVIELQLIVNPTPIIPLELEPIVLCDDDGDGYAIFDLTLRAGAIYGSQDPLDYTLSYYTSLADAELDENPIGNPTAFSNTMIPQQTIWVRLADDNTDCIKIGEFDIWAEIGPQIFQPEPLSMCDDLGEPFDGITVFDLTLKNVEITGGALGVTVSYYETQADAEADTDVIENDTAYSNLISNPQIVWVRVNDVNTDCFETGVYLTLRVEANPDPEDPDPIILCDVDNPGDGFEVFD
ncbi:MAG: hypothetical protein JKY04_07130, partial [Sneathiella sp.]|nr:hypothetical protein [Sneathiella sp.]